MGLFPISYRGHLHQAAGQQLPLQKEGVTEIIIVTSGFNIQSSPLSCEESEPCLPRLTQITVRPRKSKAKGGKQGSALYIWKSFLMSSSDERKMAGRKDRGHTPNHLLQFVSLPRWENSYNPAWFCIQCNEVGQDTGGRAASQGPWTKERCQLWTAIISPTHSCDQHAVPSPHPPPKSDDEKTKQNTNQNNTMT